MGSQNLMIILHNEQLIKTKAAIPFWTSSDSTEQNMAQMRLKAGES